MELRFLAPIAYTIQPGSPEIDESKQAIRIAVTNVAFDGADVSFDLIVTFLAPSHLTDRYAEFQESMVIVVHDIEQADGGSLRAVNDFVLPIPGTPAGPNQVKEPELPMPGRGDLASPSYRGGWFDTTIGFPCRVAVPRYRPSVYVYLVVENFVSNVVGIDLVDKKAVE